MLDLSASMVRPEGPNSTTSGATHDPSRDRTFVIWVALVVIWAVLGPGGWVSGVVGALVGLGVAGVLVLRRRRDSSRP